MRKNSAARQSWGGIGLADLGCECERLSTAGARQSGRDAEEVGGRRSRVQGDRRHVTSPPPTAINRSAHAVRACESRHLPKSCRRKNDAKSLNEAELNASSAIQSAGDGLVLSCTELAFATMCRTPTTKMNSREVMRTVIGGSSNREIPPARIGGSAALHCPRGSLAPRVSRAGCLRPRQRHPRRHAQARALPRRQICPDAGDRERRARRTRSANLRPLAHLRSPPPCPSRPPSPSLKHSRVRPGRDRLPCEVLGELYVPACPTDPPPPRRSVPA